MNIRHGMRVMDPATCEYGYIGDVNHNGLVRVIFESALGKTTDVKDYERNMLVFRSIRVF